MESIESLQRRLRQLEVEIAEAERRLPAHSTKPPVMKLLLDLEDAYDRVLAQIQAQKAKS